MFKRGSGILLHISSLPSPAGIGDLGPVAYKFADLLYDASQTYWQVLPLNPGNSENGESPYFSSSAFAGNPLLISLDKLSDDGLLCKEDTIPPVPLKIESVNYEAVRKFKYVALDKAFTNWCGVGKDKAFGEFCEEEAFWLDDYALFLTIGEKYGTFLWHQWPETLRNRNTTEIISFKSTASKAIERIKFFQYIVYKQWKELKLYCNSKGIVLIGDMPIYVSYESSDVWVHHDNFKLNFEGKPLKVSGVPPDYFSATGQLWNNPVYSWENIRKTGYRWWVQRMQTLFSMYDIVRIDHFRGLVQYWEITAGELTAINGCWEDVPTREFLDTLKKGSPNFPVIAEDLGIITPDVNEIIQEYGLPGMKVLLFAFGEDNASNPYLPHNYEKNCLVYTGTHDNNTVRGWLESEATELEKERVFRYIGGRKSDEETVWELIRIAQSSIAAISITPLQDILFLGADARMNQPAKVTGNWKWRVTPSQFESIPVKKLNRYAKIYGRELGRKN